MLLPIIITAIITFVIVGLWSKYAYTKGNKNLYVAFEALKNELNAMSQELGHQDIGDYWKSKKGQEYAQRATENIENTLKFLRNG